jgi:uncharacterized membrane protein HdeD (DUF308 family)
MNTTLKQSPILAIEGILLIVLGVIALIAPVAAGITVSLLFGLILIASGIGGLISTFMGPAHTHRGLAFASAVVAILIGVALLVFPLAGPLALSMLLGAYLLVDGLILIGMAVDLRKRKSARWGWMLGSGILDLVLAVVLLLLTGVGSAILVGIVIGVDLIVAGAALLFIHRAHAPLVVLAPAPEDGLGRPI